MSKLSDLKSKTTPLTLSNGLVLELAPLTIGGEAEVAEYMNDDATFKAVTYMVTSAIKRALPEATDEEIDNLNKEDLKLITDRVMKINNLSGDDSKKVKEGKAGKELVKS